EALGLTQYQNKKNDALKKLQKTEENLVSIKSLLRELAPHVRYLEREMKLIEKRKELSAELIERMQEYVQAFLPFTNLELKEREESYAEVLEKERAIIESQQKVATDDFSGEYQTKRVALREEINAVENSWNLLRK